MLIHKDYKTIKGKMDYHGLISEKGEVYHILNYYALHGEIDYGYYLVIPTKTKENWLLLRKIIVANEKK